MNAPAFKVDEKVEVRIRSGQLGSWSPAMVVSVHADGCGVRRGPHYDVETPNGYVLGEVAERDIRRPRRKPLPSAPPAKRKRKAAKPLASQGRGPLRFPKFKAWVKKEPCIFCQQAADDPHHYGPKGMGQTTDDSRIVPVCRKGHDACHARRPDELCAFALRGVSWLEVEAHIYRKQVDLITEYLRLNGGVLD